MKNNKVLLSLLSIALLGTSTGYARYKSMPLVKQAVSSSVAKKDEILLKHKVFTAKDCKKHFNSKTIIKKKFQPVQITVTNNSQTSISISSQGLNFSCITGQEVADTLHRSSKARGLGLGIPGMCFGGLAMIIPAFVQGLGAHDFNDDMDADFANKELQDQIVLPGATVTGVVFTTRDNKKNIKKLTLTVKDEVTKASIILS